MILTYIGLGANLPSAAGAPHETLAAAAERLASLGRVVARSSLYSTTPVGFAEQPRFLNAVVAIETELGPHQLLRALLAIEREFGRDRAGAIPNGPRTLDLDILLYGSLRVSEAGIEIPHPRLAERAFVLVPLAQIAPEAVEPVSGARVKELLERLRAGHPSEWNQSANEVVAIECDDWRAGGDCGHDGGARAESGADSHHG